MESISMNPVTDIRRPKPNASWRMARHILCFSLFPIQIVTTVFAANADLNYTSPSTGVDGPLVIPDTLPAWAEKSFPILLAYDESNDYLMAMGRESETPLLKGSYGFYALKDETWSKLGNSRYLSETSITYDGARQEIVRFGGITTDTSAYQSGLYAWDGSEWVLKTTQDNIRPPVRSGTAMAFDAARGEVVLFGGENNNGYLNDTWIWNGTTWTDKTTSTSPSFRIRGTMAFDAARGEIVLFGGEYLNDTWTWNGATWTEESPSNVPPSRESSSLAYDSNRQVVVLCLTGSKNLETWEWNGSDWAKTATTTDPGERQFHGIVYSPDTSSIQLYNGVYPSSSDRNADSWSWDGTNWTQLTISPFLFDMTEKPDGIWNYTTIDVGKTEVRFSKNEGNTPVIWLATGEVTIDGHLNLNGTQGHSGQDPLVNTPAAAGPGGFNGGLGGYYEPATGENTPGFPGMGPGGGAASLTGGANGDWDGYHATHFDVYNSPSLQALSGGSGGGGSATTFYFESNQWGRGGNGGGGGGSILIASSRDIWLNGSITAIGGEGGFETYRTSLAIKTTFPQGGSGSGGSIRLVADRVLLFNASSLDASSDINTASNGHDRNDVPENKGRIRIEAYNQNVSWAGNTGNEHYSITAPKTTLLNPDVPVLTIDSIAGQGVSINPSSDPSSPEVTFSSPGAVAIVVSSQNIPDGSTINLRVTSGTEIVAADPQVLAGGAVNFSLIVPIGTGVVQAWTDWEVAP